VIVTEGLIQLIGQDVLGDADVENSAEVVDPLPADQDGDSLVEVDSADVVAGQDEPADPLPGVAEAPTLVSVILLSDAVKNVAVPEIVVKVPGMGMIVIASPELEDVVPELEDVVLELEDVVPELEDVVLKLEDVVLELDRLVGIEVENSVRIRVSTWVVELPKDVERDVRVPVGTRQEAVPC
jgi:hypothetical protein